MELVRGPSCYITWRASRFPLPEVQLEKANRKHVSTKVPKERKENFSPTKRGKEGRVLSPSSLNISHKKQRRSLPS
jgi:hypothetical protein